MLSMGDGFSVGVYLTPCASPVTGPGEVVITLGLLPSGRPLTLTVTSLEWLDDLTEAVQQARAAGIVEGGMMTLAVAS
jgi:hypothetical protein